MKIGILGNGQLGRMLAASVTDLNDVDVLLYDLNQHDDAALNAFLASVERVTYETENIPAHIVDQLDAVADKVLPNLTALRTFQNRLKEKNALRNAGIATAEFRAVNSLDDLHKAVEELGLPLVLKTTTEGYDGKGQFVLKQPADAEKAWAAIGNRELIAEAFVDIIRELSVIGCRDHQGNMVFWPMTENLHHEGILRYSLYPPHNLDPAQVEQAQEYGRHLADSLNYVGTITLELFATKDGLVANEVAPRVHNSGHWSIEGCVSSQFRNHILAIAGRELGPTDARYPAVAMVNVIGDETPTEKLKDLPDTFIHSYGKSPRPGRKLGHVTVVAQSWPERDAKVDALVELIPEPARPSRQ